MEADGHFCVRATQLAKYPRIECRFELSQRQVDHNGNNNLYFLEEIAKLLHTTVKPTKVETRNPQYRIRTNNLKGNLSLIDYLDRYPLFSSKFLDYKS
jgi:hypothetical protein